MRIGSLFSGYGGLDLAVMQVLGGDIAWHVEYDKAPSRILNHHWPDVPNYGDVTKLDFRSVEPVDVLTGGYPCQPFSHAGLRKGTNDDRHLWPHVLRAIREMAPRLAILENVRGHLSLGFDVVLADLADVGWSARWGVVRASDAGAPHQRARLFIIAYPSSNAGGERRGLSGVGGWSDQAEQVGLGDWGNAAYPDGGRREQPDQGERLLQFPDEDSHGTLADASGQRHGRGQDAGMVGRLGTAPEGSGRQASPARAQSGDRGTAATTDACDCQQQIDQGHDRLNGERTPLGRGAVVTAGARGNGVDSVGALAGSHAARGSVASCDCGATADADLAGSQARRNARHDGERLRVEPVGPAQPVAYADKLGPQGGESEGRLLMPAWGDYAPAIARWERVIGRPAPAPTEPGRTGAPRLSPAFVEWMMGLPAGWVTDPAIGISRNDQLKALGNGVVPQQAALALDVLLQGASDDLRQVFATV